MIRMAKVKGGFMRIFWLVVDVLYSIFSLVMAPASLLQSRLGSLRLPMTYKVWDFFQVSSVRHHYYQPVFDVNMLPGMLWQKPDEMVGVDLNEEKQLKLLETFSYQDELRNVPLVPDGDSLNFFHNNSYGPADAEMLYNIVRHFKPSRVIEVGCGYSTRMLKKALDTNRSDGSESTHICIEPYEMPWLESLGVNEVIRKKIEDVPVELFESLEENDILFIDSSHVIRTGGDVVFEFTKVLPRLKSGVIVHIHDIFLPYEYPREWLVKHRRYWTEQYLLQAFMAFNNEFEIVAAVNWLAREHAEELAQACPVYDRLKTGHGAFWIRKK